MIEQIILAHHKELHITQPTSYTKLTQPNNIIPFKTAAPKNTNLENE